MVNELFSEIFLVVYTESSSCEVKWPLRDLLKLVTASSSSPHLLACLDVTNTGSAGGRSFYWPPWLRCSLFLQRRKQCSSCSCTSLATPCLCSPSLLSQPPLHFIRSWLSVTSPSPDPSHCTCKGVGPKAIRTFHIGVKAFILTLVSPHKEMLLTGKECGHFPDCLADGNKEWLGWQDDCENFCIISQTLF